MRIAAINWPEDRIEHIARNGVTPKEVERLMKKRKLPKTDSIQELAEFWDTHDLTDFEDELEEVHEPIFQRGSTNKELEDDGRTIREEPPS